MRSMAASEHRVLERRDADREVVVDGALDELLRNLRRHDEDLGRRHVGARHEMKSDQGAGEPETDSCDGGPPRADESIRHLEHQRHPARFGHSVSRFRERRAC